METTTIDLLPEIEELLGSSRGSGVNRSFLCPFHDERRPSFSINILEGLWHCFGCGRSGNFDRLMWEFGVKPSHEYILKKALRSTEYEPRESHNFAPLANSLHRSLLNGGGRDVYEDYCEKRGLVAGVAEAFGIGWDSEHNRLSLPYWDSEDERVTGLKYRYPDGSKGSESGSEYGVYAVSNVIGRERVIICEGESDSHSAYSRLAGTDIAVCGTSGASVSEARWSSFGLHFLFARRIYLAYDPDDAGDKCSELAMRVLGTDKCVRLTGFREGGDLSEHFLRGGTWEELGVEV